MNYYISDLHFGHESIIRACKRPFVSVDEMDEALISNWNRRVQKNDTVYVVGDMMHKSRQTAAHYLEQLNGNKVLILGNHDEAWLRQEGADAYFVEVTKYKEDYIDGHHMTLCHYPMLEWKNSRKVGSDKLGYLIYGHIHNRQGAMYAPIMSVGHTLNCGADINGYTPVTFSELLANNDRLKLSRMTDEEARAAYLCHRYHLQHHDSTGDPYEAHLLQAAAEQDDRTERIVSLLLGALENKKQVSKDMVWEWFGEKVQTALMERLSLDDTSN